MAFRARVTIAHPYAVSTLLVQCSDNFSALLQRRGIEGIYPRMNDPDPLPKLDATQQFRCSKIEKAAYRRAALKCRLKTSDWIRSVLGAELRKMDAKK